MRRGILALVCTGLLASCSEAIKTGKAAGDTVTQVTFSEAGDDKDPSVSPDGKWLLYVSSEFTESDHIYLKMIGTQTVQRITEGDFDCRHPVFNPADPTEMAFASNINGEWDIFTCKIDGARDSANWTRIGLRGSHDIGCSFSPDGRYVAFSTSRSKLDWYVCVYDRDARRVYEFRNITGLLPKWNPKDNRILIQRMRERGNWYSGIWYFTFPSEPGQTTELVNIISGSDWAAINPAWDPDGKRVVFAMIKPDQPVPASTGKEGEITARSLWKIDADGTLKQITSDAYFYWLPSWSSDGNIYFVSDRSGKKNIWSLAAK